MALTAAQLAEQKKQAEELLFSGPQTLGFAKALYFGYFNAKTLFPYPQLKAEERVAVEEAVAKVRQFCQDKIDAAAIDRQADIPRSVIDGLGELGVLGMTAPKELGGLGFSQQGYCKVLEVIGGHCASTAVFVNAHGSIGIRALVLFGTPEQQQRWLPGLVSGQKLAAFALTEPQAGSDAAGLQTTATPTEDGAGYLLNGQKRYITNGGIADVLTVMARTPVPGSSETKITAFLVTPDMPGFRVLEARADKCGIRGTATGKMAFENMFVPKENILGPIGKGLRVALTVLDFGRTTFGATCTGAAKTCLAAATRHAKTRVQFKQPLADFQLVQKKLAFMASHTYAMEAMTTACAAFIDSGAEDYMLETAMLKVFATEHLWTIVNETIQIFGGQAYFTDEPYERMMRDARINMIGEGANEVLLAFIAVVGMRGPGMEALGVLNALGLKPEDFGLFSALRGMLLHPVKGASAALKFGGKQASARLSAPQVPVQNRQLAGYARTLAKLVQQFGIAVTWALRSSGSEAKFLLNQLLQEKIAWAAIDLYAASCVLSRLDSTLTQQAQANGHATPIDRELAYGKHFLHVAFRRIRQQLAALDDNDDQSTIDCAKAVLAD